MPRRTLTSPRKHAVQGRAKATVDALLGATARILVKEGYDRASTNKIAEAAGVSVGSLYQYFPSKEALVAAVIERHSGQMVAEMMESFARVASLPLEASVRELVRVMIDAHRIEPKLHRVLVEQTPRVGALGTIEQVSEQGVKLVRAYLEARRSEIVVEDLDLAAFVTATTVEALTHVAVLHRHDLLEKPSFGEEVARIVVRYLRGGDAPPVNAGRIRGR